MALKPCNNDNIVYKFWPCINIPSEKRFQEMQLSFFGLDSKHKDFRDVSGLGCSVDVSGREE